MENDFHPLLVYNNRPGTEDEKILHRHGEPAWNYQVIRFLDANGRDILPRQAGVWELGAVAERMVAALTAANRPVPEPLRALAVPPE